MINKVILIGNLGKDPELRHTSSGAAVTSFSVATSESYKDKAGEWQNLTEWHNIVLWNEAAERAEKQLKKGDKVYIEGKLKTDKYDKEGATHYSTKIIASLFRSLEKKEAVNQEPVTQEEMESRASGTTEDDLPF